MSAPCITPDTIITCREARLLLLEIPHDKPIVEWSLHANEANKHYRECPDCIVLGMGPLTGCQLTCQESLLLCAEHIHWGHNIGGQTIREQVAIEHVFGWPTTLEQRSFGAYTNHCRMAPCLKFIQHRYERTRNAHEDRPDYGYLPFFLPLFVEQGWPLDKLFELQMKRVSGQNEAIAQLRTLQAIIRELRK